MKKLLLLGTLVSGLFTHIFAFDSSDALRFGFVGLGFVTMIHQGRTLIKGPSEKIKQENPLGTLFFKGLGAAEVGVGCLYGSLTAFNLTAGIVVAPDWKTKLICAASLATCGGLHKYLSSPVGNIRPNTTSAERSWTSPKK